MRPPAGATFSGELPLLRAGVRSPTTRLAAPALAPRPHGAARQLRVRAAGRRTQADGDAAGRVPCRPLGSGAARARVVALPPS
eukprot:356781-Chlamydomonas_euryale.AAC.8